MNKEYRLLNREEIDRLVLQGCTAEDWSHVWVVESFSVCNLYGVRFVGDVRLGCFEKELKINETVTRHSGIRNVELRNVTVGDNCLIENVGSYIANYRIGDNTYISHVGVMETVGKTRFGVGTEVPVLQEAGDELMLTLHPGLTAQEAYLAVKYPEWDGRFWNEVVRKEYLPTETGYVGKSVVITHVQMLQNTFVGDGCRLEGTAYLSDVMLNGTLEAPASIGMACIVRSSIVSSGAHVTDGARVNRCFVGNAVHLGNGFTATDSVFFANCHLENGEACSVIAGPYTVSHHKASLLIGCMTSFINFGSGVNMSNHGYKIGPVHYGILERGCKTASNAHLVWPAHIGLFSMVMGKVANRVDTTPFPFSYIFGDGNRTYLIPGINSMTLGTFRDMLKWPSRDKRKAVCKSDHIATYDWLNPLLMNQLRNGLQLLKNLKENQPDAELYIYNKVYIRPEALERGIVCYEKLLALCWGKYYVTCMRPFKKGKEQLELMEKYPVNYAQGWDDLLGLPVPISLVRHLLTSLKHSDHPLSELESGLSRAYYDYRAHLYLWQHSKDGLADDDIEGLAKCYPVVLKEQEEAVFADMAKEQNWGDVPEAYANQVKEGVREYFRQEKLLTDEIS